MEDRESRIQQLLDKEDIREALMRYCRGVDRVDADLVSSVYHPDAVDDHGDFAVDGERVGALLTTLSGRGSNGGAHFLGNVTIDLDGDRANVESYFMAIKDVDRDGKSYIRIRAGRYLDVFERRAGEWKIVERALVDDWNLVNEIQGRIGPRENYRHGVKGPTDLVFQLGRSPLPRSVSADLDAAARKPVFPT